MLYLSMAIKNLVRHKKRTLITASAIAMGILAFLAIESLLLGTELDSVRNIVWYESSSAKIYSAQGAEDWKKLSIQFPLENGMALVETLRAAKIAAVPRTSFMAELSLLSAQSGQRVAEYIKAIGIDPLWDQTVFSTKGLGLEGRWVEPGEYGLVLGSWLAEDMGAVLGDEVSLNTRTREGSYQVLDLEIVGILDSPNPMVNRGSAYLALDVVDYELGMGGMPGEIALSFPLTDDSSRRVAEVVDVLGDQAKGVRVLPWEELASDFLALAGAKTKGTSFILFLVFVIAAVGISNTLLMAFYERRNEIGMLRAIGMPDRALFWTFVAEAGAIGFLGSLLGVVLGIIPVWLLTEYGLDMGFIMRETDMGYRITGIMRGVFLPGSFIKALVLGVVLAGLTSIFPTRRALQMPITDALRVE